MATYSRGRRCARPVSSRCRGFLPACLAALGSLLTAACDDSTPPASVRLAPVLEPPAEPPPAPEPEPLPEIPAVVTDWIEANAHPFDGSHLSLPHTDLEFLRDLIGDARIVALGENTHGTRDFFEMKARILRFLVEEMDFDAFVIEATWPEARRVDHYVRTGEGDAHTFLSALYFWTWRTESVLEMIEWMRDHNEAGGDVGFHGNDMQSPGMALHNVRGYFETVDPDAAPDVTERLHCLTRVANDHTGRSPSVGYDDQSESYRTNCGLSSTACGRSSPRTGSATQPRAVRRLSKSPYRACGSPPSIT